MFKMQEYECPDCGWRGERLTDGSQELCQVGINFYEDDRPYCGAILVPRISAVRGWMGNRDWKGTPRS